MNYFIKCNCLGPKYLYWSGVSWTANFAHAQRYREVKYAKAEITSLSAPGIKDPKGRGIEVSTLNPEEIDKEF